jgi:hypothetical protein
MNSATLVSMILAGPVGMIILVIVKNIAQKKNHPFLVICLTPSKIHYDKDYGNTYIKNKLCLHTHRNNPVT